MVLAEISRRNAKRKQNGLKDGFEPWAEIRDESCSYASFITQSDMVIKCIYL